jgi:hypothetical protein
MTQQKSTTNEARRRKPDRLSIRGSKVSIIVVAMHPFGS